MYIERQSLQEYPFNGAFYTFGIDESKPLDEQVEEEILLFETKCDIQESTSTSNGGAISASFDVYFPFDKKVGVGLQRGDIFKGSFYGVKVEGIVQGLFPTQLGGCAVHLVDKN